MWSFAQAFHVEYLQYMLNSFWNWFGIFCDSCPSLANTNCIIGQLWYAIHASLEHMKDQIWLGITLGIIQGRQCPFCWFQLHLPCGKATKNRHMACTGKSAKGFRQMGQPQMVCLWFGRCCDTGNDPHSTCKTILVIKIWPERNKPS